MTDTLADLAERIEGAEGPSREIDADLWWRLCERASGAAFHNAAMGLPRPLDHSRPPLAGLGRAAVSACAPEFTKSLDAALRLLEEKLPGWFWRAGYVPYGHYHQGRATHGWAHISRTDASNCNREDEATGWAVTPALALCAAILRALAQEPTDG